ncbi:MAG: MaoC family dehydratase [Gemmatimonadota bacterium]
MAADGDGAARDGSTRDRSTRAEGIPFEELTVGRSATFTKTVTETDVVLFAGITGDMNPLHVDREAAGRSRFGGRLAHGMLTAGLVSAVLGTRLPGPGCVYLSQSLRFVAPVRIGDTVTARVEVTGLEPDRNLVRLRTTCANQEGETVLEGEAELLVP